jgi:hypothetical protein
MSATLERLEMMQREVNLLIAIEPVLKRLGLSLYCVRCHAKGIPDGVRALNAPGDTELVVECGCMTRRYKNLETRALKSLDGFLLLHPRCHARRHPPTTFGQALGRRQAIPAIALCIGDARFLRQPRPRPPRPVIHCGSRDGGDTTVRR